MSEIDNVNPESTELPVVENLTPISLAEEIEAEVQEELKTEAAEIEEEIATDDLNKKNYVKITPTFYIQPVETEEVNGEGEKLEMYKILNPVTGVVETRELTGEEKRDIRIQQLKDSKIKFRSIRHGAVKTVGMQTVVSSIGRERKVKEKALVTNITTNQFGADYRKKRQRKNKMQKASRKANR